MTRTIRAFKEDNYLSSCADGRSENFRFLDLKFQRRTATNEFVLPFQGECSCCRSPRGRCPGLFWLRPSAFGLGRRRERSKPSARRRSYLRTGTSKVDARGVFDFRPPMLNRFLLMGWVVATVVVAAGCASDS